MVRIKFAHVTVFVAVLGVALAPSVASAGETEDGGTELLAYHQCQEAVPNMGPQEFACFMAGMMVAAACGQMNRWIAPVCYAIA